MTKPMEKEKNEVKTTISAVAKEVASLIEQKSVLLDSYKKALTELAKAAADGDLDAIKLLSESIQEEQELKLRKELFGV